MINAIVMASGLSKRMGKNKLLLPFKGKALIEHTLNIVSNCGFTSICLVTNDTYICEIGHKLNLIVLFNNNACKGQSESIKLGLSFLPQGKGYAFFTGDQPLMDVNSIKLLMDNFQKDQEKIIVPCYKNNSGSPVIFPHKLKPELLTLDGDNGGKIVMNNNPDLIKYVPIKNANFLWDIDTMNDYDILLRNYQ